MPRKYVNPIAWIMSRVSVQPNGCWIWNGYINDNGYAGCRFNGRTTRAHCVSYELHNGPIPQGMDLDHTCHDPKMCSGGPDCSHRRCVNPDHLEPVTRRENIQRGALGQKWSEKTVIQVACKWGHEFTEENTYIFRDRRHCRICAALRIVAFRQAKRGAQNVS